MSFRACLVQNIKKKKKRSTEDHFPDSNIQLTDSNQFYDKNLHMIHLIFSEKTEPTPEHLNASRSNKHLRPTTMIINESSSCCNMSHVLDSITDWNLITFDDMRTKITWQPTTKPKEIKSRDYHLSSSRKGQLGIKKIKSGQNRLSGLINLKGPFAQYPMKAEQSKPWIEEHNNIDGKKQANNKTTTTTYVVAHNNEDPTTKKGHEFKHLKRWGKKI